MVKKISVILSVLMLAMPLKAGVVTPETAARCAASVLNVSGMPLPSGSVPARAAGRDGSASVPDYYVCNYPEGGWVIIASDDRMSPVIAYSPQGSFSTENMPDNLRVWMDQVSMSVREIRDSQDGASDDIRNEWNSLLVGRAPSRGESKVLKTAVWHQDEPYNNLCPVAGTETKRAAAGCANVAMAIIMRYNKWPEHGTGLIGDYVTQAKSLYIPAFSIDDHYYDWDNMPLSDGGKPESGWTQSQKDEVARLIYDCAVMNHSYFAADGSGTNSQDVYESFRNYLSYPKTACVYRNAYDSYDEWFAVLKGEIDANRLSLYFAYSNDGGGHAFVCDGYDTNGSKLHFNWGWGDISGNGFYSLKALNSMLPIKHEAIVGLSSDTTQSVVYDKTQLSVIYMDGLYGLRMVDYTGFSVGDRLSFLVGYLDVWGEIPQEQELKICVEDKDGTVKQEGWFVTLKYDQMIGDDYIDPNVSDVLNVRLLPTDIFKLYYRKPDGSWTPMPGDKDVIPGVDHVICGVYPNPLILVPDDMVPGEETVLSLTYSLVPHKSVEWTVNGESCPEGKAVLNRGNNSIKAKVVEMNGSETTVYRNIVL